MDKKIYGVEIYALMSDREEIGKFVLNGENLELEFNDGYNETNLPYMLKLGYKKNFKSVLETWVKNRLLQKDRIGRKEMMKRMGILFYNEGALFKHGHASMMKDSYWISFSPEDKFEVCSQRGIMGVENSNTTANKIVGLTVYSFMDRDKELGVFEVEDNKLKLVLHEGVSLEILPYILKLNFNSDLSHPLETWVRERLYKKDIVNRDRVMKIFDIVRYSEYEMFKATHAAITSDSYWISFFKNEKFDIDLLKEKCEDG